MGQVWQSKLRALSMYAIAVILLMGCPALSGAAAGSNATSSAQVVQVASGVSHVMALTEDGRVWTWGHNASGALGQGDTLQNAKPAALASLPPIQAIDAGHDHSMALDRDGQVWVWGENLRGQLGNGTYSKLGPPLSDGGRAVADDNGSRVPLKLNGLPKIAAIAASDRGSYAVDLQGQVWHWGEALQLDDPSMPKEFAEQEKAKLLPATVPGLSDIREVVPGVYLNRAITKSGEVIEWGMERMADGSLRRLDSPRRAGGLGAVKSLRANAVTAWVFEQGGTVRQWGLELMDESGLNYTDPKAAGKIPSHDAPTATSALQGYADIQSSTYQIARPSLAALKADGTVWGWGSNAQGQLGAKTPATSSQWVKIPGVQSIVGIHAAYGTVFAIDADGRLYAWGLNDGGKLGDGSEAASRAAALAITGFGPAKGSATGSEKPTNAGGQAPAEAKKPQPQPPASQPDRSPAADAGIALYVNQEKLALAAEGSPSGTTMVPFRGIFQAFNMNVDWNQQTRSVTAVKDGLSITMTPGSRTAYVNGDAVTLTEAPRVNRDGLLLVNLRFISETLGAKVDYAKLPDGGASVSIQFN
jgi:alpha-tubulin suppressor-like RCC1 family protein